MCWGGGMGREGEDKLQLVGGVGVCVWGGSWEGRGRRSCTWWVDCLLLPAYYYCNTGIHPCTDYPGVHPCTNYPKPSVLMPVPWCPHAPPQEVESLNAKLNELVEKSSKDREDLARQLKVGGRGRCRWLRCFVCSSVAAA